MLAAKDQIRRHGPFRRLRRALIRQPQRILSRVRRVFVSLAPAIAPSRVRFAARFKKPLARAPEINRSRARVVVVAPSSPPSRALLVRLRRVRVASASPSVLSSSPRRARSFASRACVRVRVDRSFALSRSIARPSASLRARTNDRRAIDRARTSSSARGVARASRAVECVANGTIRVRDSCGCGFYAQTVRRRRRRATGPRAYGT